MEQSKRLTSLDFFRGFTMLLLVNAGFLQFFTGPEFDGTIAHHFFIQFTHTEWTGLHFWDLVQPFFMFVVGVAIPFSVAKRLKSGQSWSQLTRHAAFRSLILIFLGISRKISVDDPTPYLTNVLTQIGLSYFFIFLLIRTRVSVQLAVSIGLLALTEILYRTFPLEGFNQPFSEWHNFGDFIDLHILGSVNPSKYVSFNAIPTAAHIIWGAVCGQLLRANLSNGKKLKYLTIGGLAALATGYSISSVTPIIKHIATSSFVLTSGGWTILSLTLLYWIIDVKQHKNWTLFGVVVGMNPIFIYILGSYIKQVVHGYVHPWIAIIFGWTSPTFLTALMLATAWFFNWLVCYILYKKNIFIRI